MKRIASILLLLCTLCLVATVAASPGFRELCKQIAASGGGASVIDGLDGWLFLKDEITHLGSGKFWGEESVSATRAKNKKFADPLPPIVKYNKQLEEKGISFYLLPIPPKALIYPDKLQAGITPELASQELELYQAFYRELEESGVKVIDVLPAFMKNRDKAQLYCRTDTHFSGQGLAYVATTAAEKIKAEPWYQEIEKQQFDKNEVSVSITGDLVRMAGRKDGGEELELSVVSVKSSGSPVASNDKSPVVLLGDSHALVFSVGGDLHAKGAGLFDHLSADLGFPVDLLGVRGSGVNPARIKFYQRSKKDKSYLTDKKVLIWCFTARDFTGSGGWRDIPVAP